MKYNLLGYLFLFLCLFIYLPPPSYSQMRAIPSVSNRSKRGSSRRKRGASHKKKSALSSQEQSIVIGEAHSKNLITLELTNVDILEAIKLLSQKGSFSVVIAPEVKGRVTLFIKNVNILTAFQAVLESADLAYTKSQGVISIVPNAAIKETTGTSFYDNRQHLFFDLQHADADQVTTALNQALPAVQCLADDRTNRVMVHGSEADLPLIQQIIQSMDQPVETIHYPMKYLERLTAEALISMSLGSQGSYSFNSQGNTVVIRDFSENIKKISALLKMNDIPSPLITKIYDLNYASYETMEPQLKSILTPDLGQILVDERTQKILISDIPSNFKSIEHCIQNYDTHNRQVLIEASIVEVTTHNHVQYGINWQSILEHIDNSELDIKVANIFDSPAASVVTGSGFAKNIQNLGKTSDSLPSPISTSTQSFTTSSATTGGITSNSQTSNISKSLTTSNEALSSEIQPLNQTISFPTGGGARIIATGTLNGKKFEAVMNALQTVGDTKTLSRPSLLAIHNEEAKIEVIQKRPYVSSSTATSETGPATTSENVTQVDIGLTLSITPTINSQGMILLKVDSTHSTVQSELVAASGNIIPIVSRQTIESIIQVENGEMIILGGFLEQKNTTREEKIPFLGEIPLMGWLFKKWDHPQLQHELVVFLTANIFTEKQES